MRRFVAIAVLAACGHVGFEPGSDPDAGYRRHIAIDHTKVVNGPLVDFPVLVRIVDPELGAAARSDGRDIVFIGSAPLAHELESFDDVTGTLLAWVKVPSASSLVDTTFDLAVDATLASDRSREVWSNNFVAVWHLSDDPAAPPPQVVDGTANGVLGTTGGAMTANQRTTGQIGRALSFDGVDDTLGFGPTSILDVGGGSMTMSAWLLVAAPAGVFDTPLVRGGAAASCPGYNIELGTGLWTAHVADGVISRTAQFSAAPILNRWVQLTAVLDRPNGFSAYVDGRLIATTNIAGLGSAAGAIPAAISSPGDGCSGASLFAGQVDEVRVASVARSADWIATEFADQSEPEAFAHLVP